MMNITRTKQQFRKTLNLVPKRKDEFLKPEDISHDGIYAITINPQQQPDLDNPTGFLDWWGKMKRLLIDDIKGAKLHLFCETSRSGRLHFHGFIKYTNPVIFSLFSVPYFVEEFSTVIKPLEDYSDWYSYCYKQQHLMQDFMHGQLKDRIKDYNTIDYDITLTAKDFWESKYFERSHEVDPKRRR